MPRAKIDEMDRIKRYLATAPVGFLYVVKGWCDLLILSKDDHMSNDPPPAKRKYTRKVRPAEAPLFATEAK